MNTRLRLVMPTADEPLLAAVERALQQERSVLLALPQLTSIALHDPYLARQLADLHTSFELAPTSEPRLLSRLRARLAWWLLGRELQHLNDVHAGMLRVLDSLLVHLDHERTTRKRLETHLAGLLTDLPRQTHLPTLDTSIPDVPPDELNVVWHSLFAGYSGYSISSHAFVLGLDARGVAVRPLFIHGGDYQDQAAAEHLPPRLRELQARPLRLDVPQVVYAAGDRFSKNSGSYRIGFTMLEVDRLPATWVEQANQMHEVWTPTEWGAEVFRASGVQRPVSVVPLGVDVQRYQPGAPRAHLRERTLFFSMFEWGTRKGWPILVRAYCAAFRASDPVLLLLKVDARELDANPVRELTAALPADAPPVCLIYNQHLTPDQLLELYQSADCFVLPSHGEGWGMPVLEAMACGTPAIATHWSGPTAFLNASNGYPLPIVAMVPTGSAAPNFRGAQWAQPDESALVDLLRQAASQPDERRRKGQHARQSALQWTWEHAVAAVYQRLASI